MNTGPRDELSHNQMDVIDNLFRKKLRKITFTPPETPRSFLNNFFETQSEVTPSNHRHTRQSL